MPPQCCFPCCKKKELFSTRVVSANQKDASFCTNKISNTKYSPLTFLPKNLWEQFGRFMNIYFIIIGVLQLFPSITPVNPITTWFPIIVIFAVSAAKEAFDDILRWRSDRRANLRLVHVARQGTLREVPSQDIHVGDIVCVRKGEAFPCDLALLKSSDEEHGLAFIQTANLDGESDLKTRSALPATQALEDSALFVFAGVVECPLPNPEAYRFDSRLFTTPPPVTQQPLGGLGGVPGMGAEGGRLGPGGLPMSERQLMLQATQLRNTEWILGLAVYTGNETKLGCNKATPPTKQTKLEKLVNILTAVIFGLQGVLVVILGIVGNVWRELWGRKLWYLMDDQPGTPFLSYLILPLRFLLLMSLMIPISIKVTLDIVKFAMAFFINWDLTMWDDEAEQGAIARSTALAEDLGQVTHVMTDKTGTLTQNVMEFVRCSITGRAFPPLGEDGLATSDPSLRSTMQSGDGPAVDFFRALALCHSVQSTVPESGREEDIEYQAASPDEEALVLAARRAGVEFVRREADVVELRVCGVTEIYEVAATIDFTPARRRMTVAVRRRDGDSIAGSSQDPDAPAVLFAKGGDDVMKERIPACVASPSTAHHSGPITHAVAETLSHLDAYAARGLRTLIIARREIEAAVFNEWQERFMESSASVVDREERVAAIGAEIEAELELLGVSAIEDKLQEEVADTIATLRKAGVVFWMLTGDKKSTAKQIACACALLAPNMIDVDGHTVHEVAPSLARAMSAMHSLRDEARTDTEGVPPPIDPATEPIAASPSFAETSTAPTARSSPHASVASVGHGSLASSHSASTASAQEGQGGPYAYTVVLEGNTFEVAVTDPRLKPDLQVLLSGASTVVCCRARPKQKAQAVRLVRDTPHRVAVPSWLPPVWPIPRNCRPTRRRQMAKKASLVAMATPHGSQHHLSQNLMGNASLERRERVRPVVLSIGDGGNDVPMLQAAHVGVGIAGREGLQASRAGDYSIQAFRHLRRLTLVHGRYAYARLAWIAQYCFYKSMFLAFIQVFYAFATGFSGASLFDSFALMCYNIVFTSLPPICFVLDRDVPVKTAYRSPQLMTPAILGRSLNTATFLRWLLRAVYQAAVVIFVTLGAYGGVGGTGHINPTIGTTKAGFVAYASVLTVQTVTLLAESNSLTLVNHIVIWGSLIVFHLGFLIASALPLFSFQGVAVHMWGDPMCWLCVVLSVVAAFIPVYAIQFFWRQSYPAPGASTPPQAARKRAKKLTTSATHLLNETEM